MFESIRGTASPAHPLAAPLWCLAIAASVHTAVVVVQAALFEYRMYRAAEVLMPFSDKLIEVGETWKAAGAKIEDAGKQIQGATK